MYTQCPQCLTVYLVDATILAGGKGEVRCGRCRAVFSALEALADEPPGDGIVTPTLPSSEPPLLTPAEEPIDEEPADLDEMEALLGRYEPSEDNPDPLPDDPVLDEILEALPTRHKAPSPSSPGWRVLAGTLAVALVLQIGWLEREQILSTPLTRGWLEGLCGIVGCELPMRRDLDQIRLASRDIRPHPSVEGALLIDATLHNQAGFRQPYPELEIRLSNLRGLPVASRRFLPSEYLERPGLIEEGMGPRTLVPLVFEVVDPGEEAVAFEFDFW